MGPRLSFEFDTSSKQALLLTSLEKLNKASFLHIDNVKQQLSELVNEQFPLSSQKRRAGNYDQYYWRFKSNKNTANRRYVRLFHEDLEDYLTSCSHDFMLQLKRIEEMLIKVNANFRLIASLNSITHEYNDQLSKLMSLQTTTDYGI